jgi:hypothetical protein
MKKIYVFATAMALLGTACAEESDGKSFRFLSFFIQNLVGKNDKPSGTYSLHLKRKTEIPTAKGTVPVYSLRVDGFPGGRKFKIAQRSVDGREFVIFEGAHLGDGNLLLEDGVRSFQTFMVSGFPPGEPIQLLLQDPQNKTMDALFFVPSPREEIVVESLKIAMYSIGKDSPFRCCEIGNLFPREKILISFPNGQSNTVKASESGVATMMVLREDATELEGVSFFSITRGENKWMVEVPWEEKHSTTLAPLLIFTVGRSPTKDEIIIAKEMYLRGPGSQWAFENHP